MEKLTYNKVLELSKTTDDLGILMIKKLEDIRTEGKLHDYYNGNPNDWLFDFYLDLSWTEPEKDVQTILSYVGFPAIQSFFLTKYGFNFEKELREALKTYDKVNKVKQSINNKSQRRPQ